MEVDTDAVQVASLAGRALRALALLGHALLEPRLVDPEPGILDEFPNRAAYVARGEARPAYRRAFAAQLAMNTGKPTTS